MEPNKGNEFLFHLSLQPDVVDHWYFKPWIRLELKVTVPTLHILIILLTHDPNKPSYTPVKLSHKKCDYFNRFNVDFLNSEQANIWKKIKK